jgi:1,4-dihydroxy-2-naphthoate octaprenyltransferase
MTVRKILQSLSLWLKASRVPFVTASIAPVILGTAIAWYETHRFDFIIGLLALFGTIFGHLGANIFNDYYDHISGNDDDNPDFTPYSGGSRIIQNGLMTPRQVYIGGVAAFLMTLIIGLALVLYSGQTALILFGLLGIGLGFAYTALPIQLVYRGIGEAAVFLTFGPIIVTGAFFAQTGSISYLVLFASIPAGLLVALILYTNEMPDEGADRRARKNTLVVKISNPRVAQCWFRLILHLVVGWILIFSVLEFFSYWTMLLVLILPQYMRLIHLSKKSSHAIAEMIRLSAGTIRFQFLTTMLWAAIFIIDGLFN